jgi:hypothetical protein
LTVLPGGLGNQLGVDLTADQVIARTRARAWDARPRRGDRARRPDKFYERIQVHRGRWLTAERDRRMPGRAIYAPVSGRVGRSSLQLHADGAKRAESGFAECGGKPTYSSHPCSSQSPEPACRYPIALLFPAHRVVRLPWRDLNHADRAGTTPGALLLSQRRTVGPAAERACATPPVAIVAPSAWP